VTPPHQDPTRGLISGPPQFLYVFSIASLLMSSYFTVFVTHSFVTAFTRASHWPLPCLSLTKTTTSSGASSADSSYVWTEILYQFTFFVQNRS